MKREDSSGSARASLAAAFLFLTACASTPETRSDGEWITLFDGTSLAGWKEVYGNDGLVEVAEGRMQIGFGSPLAGATWRGALPEIDYELELDAARLAGTDFFLGLTFPVSDAHCTLILGGWGGATVGLSCIDGRDASQNETRCTRAFERNRPYEVRLRVERERIRVWVDGEAWIDQATGGRVIGVRADVLPSCPLGVATYATRAAIGPIRMRRLGEGSE